MRAFGINWWKELTPNLEHCWLFLPELLRDWNIGSILMVATILFREQNNNIR